MIVFVRIGGTDLNPEYRPAMVVKRWGPDCLNVLLFLDGSNDDKYSSRSAFSGGEGTKECYLFDPIDPGHCPEGTTPRPSNVAWATSVTRGTGINQWTPTPPVGL